MNFDKASHLVRRLGLHRLEFKTVMAFAVVGLGLWVFTSIAEEVFEGESHWIDGAILLALRDTGANDPIGPAWFEYAMSDITALGGYAVLTLLVVLSAFYLILQRRAGVAVLMVCAVVSGTMVVAVFKAIFDRDRPDIVDHLTHATSSSFPSGHASAAALTYLTLGLLIASAQERQRARVFIVTTALLIAVLVGFSRVYLGVHWPSDVVAGWGFGAAWAVGWWLAVRLVQRWRNRPGPD